MGRSMQAIVGRRTPLSMLRSTLVPRSYLSQLLFTFRVHIMYATEQGLRSK